MIVGVALGHPPAGLAVARDRPPLEAGRVQPPELAGPALDQRLDLEVVLPHPPVPQVLWQAGDEEVGGFEDVPVGGDDKLLLCHGGDLPTRGRDPRSRGGRTEPPSRGTLRRILDQPVGTDNADRSPDRCGQKEKRRMSKRWKQRPPGSTWGDWGDDDELGRINLLTPEKVLQGVREVEAGISFCLSLPLDFPGGTALNQRRYPPVIAPTEDMRGNAATFYNVAMSTMDKFGSPSTWTCGRTTW